MALVCAAGLGFTQAAVGQHQFVPSCRSGQTLFRHGAIRAFWVDFHDSDGLEHQEALLCHPGVRTPVAIWDPGPANVVRVSDFRIVGKRLGFVIYDEGFSNGSETDVGWAGLHTTSVRWGLVNAGQNAEATDPLLPEEGLRYAIADDGSMAVISGTGCQVVSILGPNHRSDYTLGPVRVLSTAPQGGLDAGSIAITRTSVTWRTIAGIAGSVLRKAGVPATGPLQSDGC